MLERRQRLSIRYLSLIPQSFLSKRHPIESGSLANKADINELVGIDGHRNCVREIFARRGVETRPTPFIGEHFPYAD